MSRDHMVSVSKLDIVVIDEMGAPIGDPWLLMDMDANGLVLGYVVYVATDV